jgi:thioredoxin-like negative regulator of GroEL
MAKIRNYTADEVVRVIEENHGLLLVHFGSPLASSCEFVRKELEMVAPLYEDRLGVAEVELPLQDVDVLRRYSIEEIPTLILFQGKDEVERLERILLPDEFREFVESCCAFYGRHPTVDDLE